MPAKTRRLRLEFTVDVPDEIPDSKVESDMNRVFGVGVSELYGLISWGNEWKASDIRIAPNNEQAVSGDVA